MEGKEEELRSNLMLYLQQAQLPMLSKAVSSGDIGDFSPHNKCDHRTADFMF